MDYQTVFTAKDVDFSFVLLVPLLLFIVAIFFMFIMFYAKIEDKDKLFARIFSVVFVIVTMLVMISEFPKNLRVLDKFEKIFEQGQFSVVEGEIREFKEFHDADIDGGMYGYWNNTFWVRDVYFHVSSNSSYFQNDPDPEQGSFYEYTAAKKGPICKNGQQVRISYVVEENKNKIIKVEIRR